MIFEIPDDLARGLESLAATSPEAVLRAMRSLPHPSVGAVDDLEAAIAAGPLPVRDQAEFDALRSE